MRRPFRLPRSLAVAVIAGACLAACGGSSSSGVTVGGSVTGLTADGLVLQIGSTTLSLTSGTTAFTFGATFSVGTSYAVSVKTQPTGLACSIANGSGTTGSSNITDIAVTCVPAHSVGGTVTGLTSAGLVLVNGSDTVAIAPNTATFTFPTRVGQGYAYGITVLTQPATQTCTVLNGASFVGTTDVTNVQVVCS